MAHTRTPFMPISTLFRVYIEHKGTQQTRTHHTIPNITILHDSQSMNTKPYSTLDTKVVTYGAPCCPVVESYTQSKEPVRCGEEQYGQLVANGILLDPRGGW